MKLPRLRTVLLVPLILFAMFYLAGAIFLLFDDKTIAPMSDSPAEYASIVNSVDMMFPSGSRACAAESRATHYN